MRLITEIVHPKLASTQGRVFRRHAARGIVLRDEQILLLFTERYNDFSFPGGGLDGDEDIVTGLKRELEEETGAREIQVLQHYGYIEEYRPDVKPGYDLMHMTSHFYLCEIGPYLEPVKMESHEIANGMRPVWVNLAEAISHNEAVMQRQESSMGQCIQRETFMLRRSHRNHRGEVRLGRQIGLKGVRNTLSPIIAVCLNRERGMLTALLW